MAAAGITRDQTEEIIAHFGSLAPELREHAIEALSQMWRDHWRATWSVHYMPELDRHRERLESIVAAARKLTQLLREEPLRGALLLSEEEHKEEGVTRNLSHVSNSSEREQIMWCALAHGRLHGMLNDIQKNGTRFIENPSELREWRSDIRPVGQGRKPSPERFSIWEPMFRLWEHCGRGIGTSRTGALYDAIASIHKAFAIPAPSRNSIVQAIKSFKGAPPRKRRVARV